jgi:hypothetical protein
MFYWKQLFRKRWFCVKGRRLAERRQIRSSVFQTRCVFSVVCADFLKPGFCTLLKEAVSCHLPTHEGTVFLARTNPLPRSSLDPRRKARRSSTTDSLLLAHSTTNTGCSTLHSAMMLTKHRMRYTPFRHVANQTKPSQTAIWQRLTHTPDKWTILPIYKQNNLPRHAQYN